MTGSAPGADARRCVGPDCEGCRGPLPGTTCGKGKDWRARAEAAEAKLNAVRALWAQGRHRDTHREFDEYTALQTDRALAVEP